MGTHTGADISAADSQGHITGYGTKAYRSYVLNALLFVYILNFLDRGLLGIVSEPVMNELATTDGPVPYTHLTLPTNKRGVV